MKISRSWDTCVALSTMAGMLAVGCGARTGLSPGVPPDTRVTEVCQSGYCLTQPWCRSGGFGIGRGEGADIVCIQGEPDGTGLRRPDCLEPPPGGTISFCAEVHGPAPFGIPGVPVERGIPIWAHDGAEATLFCARSSEPGDCEGYIETNGLDPAPDACLFSPDTWRDYWRNCSWCPDPDAPPPPPCPMPPCPVPYTPTPLPLPWETEPATWTPYATCGLIFIDMCPSPSGVTEAASRTEWCGGMSTDWTSAGDPTYSCAYRTLPDSAFPDTSVSQLGPSFDCPKQVPLMVERSFIVAGTGDVASRRAGALGGRYCNAFAPRPQLGRLPQAISRSAPLTVFAVRDPTRCEQQEENFGFEDPTLDPGVAQSGQRATVLAGSRLEMTRDGGAGPAASMHVEGDVSVYVGPDGSFALTDFELHQAGGSVTYTDSTGTYVVTDGALRMADVWAGTYAGPGVSPNVVLTAHDSSTTMTFAFNGDHWSIPLAPDRPPSGDFDGVDRLTLRAHYHDEPDQARFELVLVLEIHPRPTVVIDHVEVAPGCRVLSDGRIGSVLTASGHAAPGTTFWQLVPEVGPGARSITLAHRAGTTASFEIPLGAPSDPAYNLTFTGLTDGQVNRDALGGFAVRDTTGPVFDSVSITPSCLWPPAHGYVLFRLGEEVVGTASDECSPTVRVRIANVVSNQPDNGPGTGSGNTTDDVRFGDSGFCLRAERDGTVRGPREYTVTLEATDAWGNLSTYDAVVAVHHDQRPPRCTEAAASAHVPDDQVDTTCVFPDVPPLPPPRSAFAVPASAGSARSPVASAGETGGCSAVRRARTSFALPATALIGLVALRRRRR